MPQKAATVNCGVPHWNGIGTRNQGAAASFAMTLILFVLAVGAFWAGMEIHHRKLTKSDERGARSLVGEIMDGSTSEQPADDGNGDEEENPEE